MYNAVVDDTSTAIRRRECAFFRAGDVVYVDSALFQRYKPEIIDKTLELCVCIGTLAVPPSLCVLARYDSSRECSFFRVGDRVCFERAMSSDSWFKGTVEGISQDGLIQIAGDDGKRAELGPRSVKLISP